MKLERNLRRSLLLFDKLSRQDNIVREISSQEESSLFSIIFNSIVIKLRRDQESSESYLITYNIDKYSIWT